MLNMFGKFLEKNNAIFFSITMVKMGMEPSKFKEESYVNQRNSL